MDLTPLKVFQHDAKMRLGIKTDGGYVIADLSGGYDCFISAGVGREESFTKEFIARHGMNQFNSFGIDGTIESYPNEYTHNISFVKKNISSVESSSGTNLQGVISQYKDIFLKMDVEGGEYEWLSWVTEAKLQRFKQIVIECHGIHNDSWGAAVEVKKACLEKLARTHYLVHAHGNNARGATNYIPNVMELTYVRKDYYKNEPLANTTSLPIPYIDYPNNPNRPDYPLNMRPFVSV